jgi:hypothetical protein
MARVAELVAPTEDTMIGAMDQAAFDRSIELLLEVGLISDAVAFEDVVDTSIYEAATGGM